VIHEDVPKALWAWVSFRKPNEFEIIEVLRGKRPNCKKICGATNRYGECGSARV